MRLLLKSVAVLACLLIGALVVLHLWPDAELNPAVAKWREDAEAPSPERNSFFTIMGLAAGPGEDANAAGIRRIQAWEKQHEQTGQWSEDASSAERFTIADELWKSLCRPEIDECLGSYAEQSAEIAGAVEQYAELIERYRSLASTPTVVDTITFKATGLPLPPYHQFARVHRLIVADTGRRFVEGDEALAVQMLDQDMVYLRAAMAETNSLVFKLIATQLLIVDLHLLSEMVDASPQSNAVDGLVEALAELTVDERSLMRAFRGEFQYTANVVDRFADDRWASLAEFTRMKKDFGLSGIELLRDWALPFKRNDTLNMIFPSYLYVAQGSELSASDYTSHRRTPYTVYVKSSDYVLNPVGLQFAGLTSAASFIDYPSRLFAVDGMIRLLKLKHGIRRGNIASTQIDRYLRDRANELGNPYNDEPMIHDEERNVLTFALPFEAQRSRSTELPLVLE